MNYVTIDFETANGESNSACSVAIVVIQNGRMVDSYSTLIKPPKMYFEPGNIEIHHITPEMVENAPTFDKVWPEMFKYLRNQVVLAHNANFDMKVLRESLSYYKIPFPIFSQLCTVQLARKVWPNLPNHKLNTMGDFFRIKFTHHDALDDAKVCAKIPLVAAKTLGVDNMMDLLNKTGLKTKPFGKK